MMRWSDFYQSGAIGTGAEYHQVETVDDLAHWLIYEWRQLFAKPDPQGLREALESVAKGET